MIIIYTTDIILVPEFMFRTEIAFWSLRNANHKYQWDNNAICRHRLSVTQNLAKE